MFTLENMEENVNIWRHKCDNSVDLYVERDKDPNLMCKIFAQIETGHIVWLIVHSVLWNIYITDDKRILMAMKFQNPHYTASGKKRFKQT